MVELRPAATWDVTWERCSVCPAPLIPDQKHVHLPRATTQLVTVHGDGTVLLSLYCWQHKTNHEFTAEQIERIVYALVARPIIPCLLVLLGWSRDERFLLADVETSIECRAIAARSTPERHRDGPDQSLADLPDPTENTFDPAADDDERRRR